MQTHIPNHIFAEMHAQLSALPKRTRKGENGESERDRIVREFAARGIRYSTYCQKVRQMQGSSRSDYGVSRKQGYWESKIRKVFELQVQMSDFDQGRFMCAEVAIAQAEAQKILENGELTKRNYNLWVAKLGLREARGIVRIQAAYPNQVHQVDVTGSAYLAVVKDLGGGEFLIRRRSPRERLAKVQKAEGLRLWSIAVKDDFSGLFASQYVVAAGESALMIQDFLLRAWRGLDQALPLRGLPEMIYCDNGPFAKHQTTIPFLSEQSGVGVELKVHMPYRAQATGKVEAVHRYQKSRFEMQFLAAGEQWTLSEVNDLLVQFAVKSAELPHRYLPISRGEAFLQYLPGAVRLPAQDANRNAFRVFRRVAGMDGLISVNGVRYMVGNDLRNRELLVYQNAVGELRVEDPLTNSVMIPEVWAGPRNYGDFESRPESQMDQTAKQRDKGQWATLPHELSDQTANRVVPFVAAEAQESKNTPFTEGREFSDKIAAKQWLAKALGIGLMEFSREYPVLWEELNGLLDQTLNRESIAQWAKRVNDGELNSAQAGGGQ